MKRVPKTSVLRQLFKRGYVRPRGPFRIAPAKRGSGHSDISVEHDRYFADGWAVADPVSVSRISRDIIPRSCDPTKAKPSS